MNEDLFNELLSSAEEMVEMEKNMENFTFTKEQLRDLNFVISENHWCRVNEDYIAISGSKYVNWNVSTDDVVKLSDGWIGIFGAGTGLFPESLLLRADKQITKGQWKEFGYEDYMVE